MLAVQAAAAQNAPPATAILAGVIRDSTAAPIADAEIIVRDIGRTGRTDARGAFELRDVPAGAHEVWFRRLGYTTIEYNWRARAGERTEIAVTLHAIPRRLDPVVVRAQEDRRTRGTSSILGLVVDTSGTPVEEAEVQLVGADRIGVTRANGGFSFRPLTSGTYLIKVRNDARSAHAKVEMHPLALVASQKIVNPRDGKPLSLEVLTQWLADKAGLPYLKIDPMKIDVAAVTQVVSHAYAQRYRILPVAVTAQQIVIATCEPFDTRWLADLGHILRRDAHRHVAVVHRAGGHVDQHCRLEAAAFAPSARDHACALRDRLRDPAFRVGDGPVVDERSDLRLRIRGNTR